MDSELLRRAEEYRRFKDEMARKSFIDFGDMVSLTYKILKDRPKLLTVVRTLFDGFIIDEAQDCSKAQHELVELLAGPNGNLWEVGDPDQTLYPWRGADKSYLVRFLERHPAGQIICLTTNYRSRASIVSAGNLLIRHNRDRIANEMKPDGERPRAMVSEAVGAALWTPTGGSGPKVRRSDIEIAEYPNDFAEAEATAGKVRGLLDVGVHPTELLLMARVMSRTYHLQLALRAKGVPIRIVGGKDAIESAEVRAMSAMLRIAAMGESVDDRLIANMLGGAARARSLSATATALGSRSALKGDWQELCRQIGGALALSPPRKGGAEAWFARVEGAAELAGMAGSLPAWLHSMKSHPKTDTSAVQVSTIHGQKGLEAEHVFIVGAEGDVLPMAGAVESEDERCVAYVAITRAKETLTVSYARTRSTSSRPCMPSIYLKEAFGDVTEAYFVRAQAPDGQGTSNLIEVLPLLPGVPNANARWEGAKLPPASNGVLSAATSARVETQPNEEGPPDRMLGVGAPSQSLTSGILKERVLAWSEASGRIWEIAVFDESGKLLFETLLSAGGDFMVGLAVGAAGVHMAHFNSAPAWDSVKGAVCALIAGRHLIIEEESPLISLFGVHDHDGLVQRTSTSEISSVTDFGRQRYGASGGTLLAIAKRTGLAEVPVRARARGELLFRVAKTIGLN